MSDDLKPCPFCGWDAPYVRTTGIETEVYCQNCTAVGPMVHSVGPDEDVDEVAIKMWNRRADAATIKAAVEIMATEHGWVRRERLEKAVNRIEELERELDEAWNAAIHKASAIANSGIEAYGAKMRAATDKKEKRDWQSMLMAAVDIQHAILTLLKRAKE